MTQKKQYEAEITIRYVASGSIANKFQIMYNSALNNLSDMDQVFIAILPLRPGAPMSHVMLFNLIHFGNPISGVVTQKIKVYI